MVKMTLMPACKAARDDATKSPEDMVRYVRYGGAYWKTRLLWQLRVEGSIT